MMTEPDRATASGTRGPQSALHPDLLALLVCPMAHAELRLEGDFLVCTRCGPKFRIEDGIPIMLIEEAMLPEGKRIEHLPCHAEVKAREEKPQNLS